MLGHDRELVGDMPPPTRHRPRMDLPSDADALDDCIVKDALLSVWRTLEQLIAAGIYSGAVDYGHEHPIVGMCGVH